MEKPGKMVKIGTRVTIAASVMQEGVSRKGKIVNYDLSTLCDMPYIVQPDDGRPITMRRDEFELDNASGD